jgi:hypothetical protein
MSDVKKAAREYLGMGWSVIPCRGKVPIGPWLEFQSRRPLVKEIDAWPEDCNVGIVTGEISNLGVIDVDSEKGFSALKKVIPANFSCPTVHTPRGGVHLYCHHTPAIRNKVGVGIEGVDFRGEGGFVVAPPSKSVDGKPYTWDEKNGRTKGIPNVPEEYLKIVIGASAMAGEKNWTGDGAIFSVGRRNNDLFHFALRLARGKTSPEEAFTVLKWVSDKCGYPEKELRLLISSAFERAGREERNLSSEIKNFINVTDGSFQIKDVAQALNIINSTDRNTLRVVLHRLKTDGIIAKSGKRDGEYVKINRELHTIDWKNAPTEEYDITLPMGLNKVVSIYPKNIIVIGGFSNAGKTCVALDIARHNQDKHPVRYFSSEMGDSELKLRLSKWEGIQPDDWKTQFYERSNDFPGVIDPNGLNIIDYLEVNDEFWKVGSVIADIYDRLSSGIAVVCIQKNAGTDYGRGGTFGAEKPRLYLSLDRIEGKHVMKIVKAKNWKGIENPNSMVREMSIVGGWKILPVGNWYFKGGK